MRHGRKSASQRSNGRKLQVATEETRELVMAVEPVPANVGHGQDLLPVIEQVEEKASVTVERAIADGAYGRGDNRAEFAERDTDWSRRWRPAKGGKDRIRDRLARPADSPTLTARRRPLTRKRERDWSSRSRPSPVTGCGVRLVRCSQTVSRAKGKGTRLRCRVMKTYC